MKRSLVLPIRYKICLSLSFALILFLVFGKPANVFSVSPENKLSDTQLYNTAFECEKRGDHFCALLFLFAYKTREPSAYLTNSTHRSNVNNEVTRLTKSINKAIVFEAEVRADLDKCDCYPCSYCQFTGRGAYTYVPPLPSKVIQIPPDVAAVCEHIDYQGKCSFLTLGDYNNAEQTGLPNDSISSVIVGSNVNLTLCLHGGMTGDCITFSASTQDPNLTDNPLFDQYSWNDNATSARVEGK